MDERADRSLGVGEMRDGSTLLDQVEIERRSVRTHVHLVRVAPEEELERRILQH